MTITSIKLPLNILMDQSMFYIKQIIAFIHKGVYILDQHPWFWQLVLLAFLFYVIYLRIRPSNRHRFNIQQSKKILLKLNTFDNAASQMNYLKKINPYVFEELILSAFERKGHIIFRNHSYSGDGGLDGVVIINGQHTIIQAKRYRSHINLQHVKDFATLCKAHNKKGLFIHTGKTGAKTKQENNHHGHIDIVSGQKLIALLL